MARQSKGGDPAATKYQSTFQNIVAKIAAVPKAEAEKLEPDKPEAENPKAPKRQRKPAKPK